MSEGIFSLYGTYEEALPEVFGGDFGVTSEVIRQPLSLSLSLSLLAVNVDISVKRGRAQFEKKKKERRGRGGRRREYRALTNIKIRDIRDMIRDILAQEEES